LAVPDVTPRAFDPTVNAYRANIHIALGSSVRLLFASDMQAGCSSGGPDDQWTGKIRILTRHPPHLAVNGRFAANSGHSKSDGMAMPASHPTADMRRRRHHVRNVPTCDIRYACFRFGADPTLERRNSGIAVSSG
jgi:hypothetical protein